MQAATSKAKQDEVALRQAADADAEAMVADAKLAAAQKEEETWERWTKQAEEQERRMQVRLLRGPGRRIGISHEREAGGRGGEGGSRPSRHGRGHTHCGSGGSTLRQQRTCHPHLPNASPACHPSMLTDRPARPPIPTGRRGERAGEAVSSPSRAGRTGVFQARAVQARQPAQRRRRGWQKSGPIR